jgi:hypothetical protein
MGGAVKSFENILTGERQEINNEKLNETIKNAGIYEVCVGGLAVASLFFVLSKDFIKYDDVWFIKYFPHGDSHFSWIPWLLMFLFFVALLISYNTTFEEIRKYYFKQKPSGIKQVIFTWAKENFYMEEFYKRVFERLLINYSVSCGNKTGLGLLPRAAMRFENGINVSIEALVGKFISVSRLVSKIDALVLDKAINKGTTGIYNFAAFLKKYQKSNLHFYLYTALAVICIFVLFKTVFL